MINGEVLIAHIITTEHGSGHYVVENAATIAIQEKNGSVGVGLAPYMPYASAKLNLRINAIASEGDPDRQLENEYSRLFGSGIVLANIVPN